MEGYLSTSNGGNTATCLVCGISTDGKLRCLAVVCEACKRFYLRQRANCSSLVCSVGDGQCLNRDDRRKTAAVCWSGAVWRFMCTRCRFDKCVEVGMRYNPTGSVKTGRRSRRSSGTPSISSDPGEASNYSQQTSPLQPLSSLPIQETSTSTSPYDTEECLNALIQNASVFLNEMHQLRMSTLLCESYSYVDNWRWALHHFDNISQCMTNFVKTLPFYKDIPVQDRCTLFTHGFAKLLTVADCYSSASADHVPCFGLTRQSAAILMQQFPELQYAEPEVRQIWSIFNCWQPSIEEIAFLLAFSFINDAVPREALAKPEMLDNAFAFLRSIYEAYKQKQRTGNAAFGRPTMQFIVKEFDKIVGRRYAAFGSILRRCPELVSINNLFTEIVEKFNARPNYH